MSEVRAQIAAATRVVVKIGSSSLTSAGGGVDDQRVATLIDAMAARRARGTQIVVVSSGAIATGFPHLGLRTRPRDLATQQASASVGQGVLLARYTQGFAGHGVTVGQVLLTSDDVTRRNHYRNAQRTFFRLLDLGVLPIVNENDTVATDEIRVGDNDRLAALVAHVVQADALVLLSDVDGLYDAPPHRPGATFIPEVREIAELDNARVGGAGAAGIGLGGMATKVQAATIASAAGIPTLLASAGQVDAALTDAQVGTVFHPTGSRASTRMLWLAHATTPSGSVTLDEGAVEAVTVRRASLLPAGITAVSGTFVAGDPIDLLDQSGRAIARGLINFDARELPELLGRSTRDLARERGPEYEREVVHRDDMVVWSSA
ncbi:MAG TPA: glutamate 5-kinase [Candidatus Nanopelagicales bacterium]|nr:glutamate 5-kinase [Candidatus Nanopelagicales bacterium]